MHDTAAVELPAATDLPNPGPRTASAWQDTGALSDEMQQPMGGG